MRNRMIGLAMTAVLASACTVAPADEEPGDEPKPTIRTYDIRALVAYTPSFDSERLLDHADVVDRDTEPFFTERDESEPGRGEMINQIQDLIRDTVDPDNWRSAGGLDNSMSELNGTLIILAKPETHQEIAKLLGMLEAYRTRRVAIEARFFTVPSGALTKLTRDAGGAGLELDAEATAKLIDRLESGDDTFALHDTVRLTGFNGRRFYTAQKEVRVRFMRDLEMHARENADTTRVFGTGRAMPRWGTVVGFEPTVNPSNETIQIVVRAERSEPTDEKDDPSPDAMPGVTQVQWRTTVVVPNGGGVILTASPQGMVRDEGEAGARREYGLLLTARALGGMEDAKKE